MNTILENPDIIPSSIHVHLASFPAVEAHLSPKMGHYADVNVIGMDLMSRIKTTVYVSDREFELDLMTHRQHYDESAS